LGPETLQFISLLKATVTTELSPWLEYELVWRAGVEVEIVVVLNRLDIGTHRPCSGISMNPL